MMGKNLNSRISVEEDRLDFLVGDYCRFSRVPESDIFVIAFSGANVPLGKFNYTNSFLGAKFNVIYLNDRLDGYYQNGIPGLADDLHATISKLRSLIFNFCEKPRVFTFGCSMGGYGAILYGTLLEVEAVLAFGPAIPKYSTPLKGKSFYNESVSRFNELEEILLDSEVKALLLFGDRSLMDVCSRGFFAFNKLFAINIYSDMCHALVYSFSQRESLSDLVMRFIDSGLGFEIPDFGFKKYLNFEIDALFFDIANAYFSGSLLKSSDVKTLANFNFDFGSLALFSAISEMLIDTDVDAAKLFFFRSIEFGINTSVFNKILPLLNRDEGYQLFLVLDHLFAVNPALIGYDSSEKRILANLYDEIFCDYSRYEISSDSDSLQGYLDGYNGRFVRGWAYDAESDPAIISIYIGDVFVADVTASDFRGDLKSKGKGVDGCCAFTLALGLDNLLKISPVTSPIQIHARDIKQRRLKYSGSYLKRPVILSSLDVNQNGLLSGWVANYTYPDSNLDYYLYLNGKYCMKFTPDVHRGDVVSKGLDMAKGFKIDVSPFCDIKEKNMIDILYGDVLTVFSGLQLSGADL